MPKMIFSQEFEGPRRRGRPRKTWKEEVELETDRKNGGILFDRPKPTEGCSANGRRRRTATEFRLKYTHTRLYNCLL
jgi:hypothetical protein